MRLTKVILIAALAANLHAANWTLIRRLTQVAACAASAADAKTTLRGGLREENSLLSNANGTPNAARIISLKAGICVGQVVVAEAMRRKPGMDILMMGVAVPQAGAFGFAAWHNAKLP